MDSNRLNVWFNRSIFAYALFVSLLFLALAWDMKDMAPKISGLSVIIVIVFWGGFERIRIPLTKPPAPRHGDYDETIPLTRDRDFEEGG